MSEQMYGKWWKNTNESEQNMEDNHHRFWRKVVAHIQEKDLSNLSVFDFGCNQGGFLRMLYETKPFRYGLGIDLAQESVKVANSRKGNLPLEYIATDRPEQYENQFDLMFSISVLYLIPDLIDHAKKARTILRDGGVYYATYTDYNGNPSLPFMKKHIDANASVPMLLHDIDDIAQAFYDQGFQIQIMRMMPNGFIDVEPDDPFYRHIKDRLQYEYEQAYIFRFSLKKS